MNGAVNKTGLMATLPPPWRENLRPQIRALVAARPAHKLVVLDDDPTGTQTVYDVPVLTTWDTETLHAEFERPGPCFYLLTNSRSLAAEAARGLNRAIARHLRAAAGQSPFTIVSRSDSTLRGHFPLETDTLAAELGPFDATIIIPYFEAGGRYTIEDVHYVAEGDRLVPAAETPFARDAVFGYQHSNLRAWVEEKTHGRVRAADVVSITLSSLRLGVPDAVALQLRALTNGATAIVNAAVAGDLEVFAAGLLAAESSGKRFLFRSAAQIVAARLGLEPRPWWRPEVGTTSCQPPMAGRLDTRPSDPRPGGLMVVGSYVPKTTEQLRQLLAAGPLEPVELSVGNLLVNWGATLTHAIQWVNHHLASGRDVVVFTSRELVTGPDATASLDIGAKVSAALVEMVRQLKVRPCYLVAKGGITSSDLATRGLGVKRAMVLGQILPGVPVWALGPETKFPGLPYVVFPGNVGGLDALKEAVTILQI